jgi:hypothetical protein
MFSMSDTTYSKVVTLILSTVVGRVDEDAVDLSGVAGQLRLQRVEVVAVDDEAAVQIGVSDGPGGVRDQWAERQCQVVIADEFLAAKFEFRHVDNYRLFRVTLQWRRGARLTSKQ